jgi:tRNA A37 threonylcarbamoyladenosine biosynthesis protein TsaE
MREVSFWIDSANAARSLGLRLGSTLEGGETVAIKGDCGEARAHLVEGLAEGLQTSRA